MLHLQDNSAQGVWQPQLIHIIILRLPAWPSTALQADERLLGGHIAALQDSIRTMADCPANRSRLYVTDTDIAALPSVAGDTVFAVKAPIGTELSVPDFESDADAPKQYK